MTPPVPKTMNPEQQMQEDGGLFGNLCALATILIIGLLTELFRANGDSPATSNPLVGEHGDSH